MNSDAQNSLVGEQQTLEALLPHQRAVSCDFGISPRCKKHWVLSRSALQRTRQLNNGKVICLFCSRAAKGSGRGNPNCKYPSLDDNFLKTIDTEGKAYLLGWIASDGCISKNGVISIAVQQGDAAILDVLREIVCAELPVRTLRQTMRVLGFNSHAMVADVCRHLQIAPGKKSHLVRFPMLASNEFGWAFVRGYFDGDGSLNSPAGARSAPRCSISSNSVEMLASLRDFCDIRCSLSADRIEWQGNSALDFLARLYDEAAFALPRKRNLYLAWAGWVPSLSGGGTHGRTPLFCWVKTHPQAVAPHKTRASDSGYDLTLIEEHSSAGPLTLYRTGIKVEPEFGWYFDVVPRSSIIKTGYMLANSVGVIDRTYRGEILVPLLKINPQAPALELPCRIVQMIPRPIVHLQIVEVAELPETSRGAGGFGSTGGHGGAKIG